jgi:hypothetical protein
MATIEADYTVLTPMFCAGADQSRPELRVPSFKGVLRFWWRALAWSRLGGDLKKIHEEEDHIFGGPGTGRSRVAIQIVLREPDPRHELKAGQRSQCWRWCAVSRLWPDGHEELTSARLLRRALQLHCSSPLARRLGLDRPVQGTAGRWSLRRTGRQDSAGIWKYRSARNKDRREANMEGAGFARRSRFCDQGLHAGQCFGGIASVHGLLSRFAHRRSDSTVS